MIVRLCSSGGAYEVIPDKQLKINLSKLKDKFEIVVETPSVVIIKDKFEVSIFKNGKLLIKRCNDKEKAEEQAKTIYQRLE